MILPHVAQRSDLIIKRPPSFYADFFPQANIHPLNELTAPKMLQKRIGKAESENVLHGFFAHIVIHSENLIFFEKRHHFLIQFFRRMYIASKRFFHKHPRPTAIAAQMSDNPLLLICSKIVSYISGGTDRWKSLARHTPDFLSISKSLSASAL